VVCFKYLLVREHQYNVLLKCLQPITISLSLCWLLTQLVMLVAFA